MFLAALRRQMADAKQFRWVDAVSILLDEKADLAADASGWLRALVEHDLVHESGRVIRRGLDEGQLPVADLESLAERDDVRSLLVTHASTEGLRSPYSALALAAIRGSDVALLEFEQYRGEISDDFLSALLSSADAGVRTATAVVIIATATPEHRPPPALLESCTPILASAEIPVPLELNFDHTFMENLRDLVPSVYQAKLLNAATSYGRDYNWRALDAFGSTPSSLSAPTKTEIWKSIPAKDRRARVLSALAGADVGWLSELLRLGDADAEEVISAVANSEAVSVADLARLVLPYGADPAAVAMTIRYGTMWGEEHERLA